MPSAGTQIKLRASPGTTPNFLTLLNGERNKLPSAIPARLGRAFAEARVPDPRFISHRVENTTRQIPTEFR